MTHLFYATGFEFLACRKSEARWEASKQAQED